MKKLVKGKFIVIFCLALGFSLAFCSLAEAQDSQGCGLGFWKQAQHFGLWEGANPDDLFSAHFGRDIEIRVKKKDGGGTTEGPTLLQALKAPGGGVNALARQAVAALLNAQSEAVDYGLTSGDVILMFQAAFDDGSKAAIEAQKDTFETLNELTCPFDSAEMEEEIE